LKSKEIELSFNISSDEYNVLVNIEYDWELDESGFEQIIYEPYVLEVTINGRSINIYREDWNEEDAYQKIEEEIDRIGIREIIEDD
jgi:hypothetical protein